MIGFLKNIEFQDPNAFWLLLIIPLMIWWQLKKHRSVLLKFSNLSQIQSLRSWKGLLAEYLPPILRILATVFIIIALARPQLSLKEEKVNAEGIDIFLVMDLSSSMLAKDFQPDRLEVSKEVAGEFVDRRTHDRIGLVVFSGEAYTQSPLTTDHLILKDLLGELKCGILQDGTAIGMGLATAVNRIKDSEAKSKVIILLTDGENNAGYIQPKTAAEIAKEFDTKVYTIGVGSTGDALAPVRQRADGQFIFGLTRVQIDEALLKEIAKMTGGKYFRATSKEALQRIYNEIDQLEKTEIEVTAFQRYSEEFSVFVAFAFLLLMIEYLLKTTLLRKFP